MAEVTIFKIKAFSQFKMSSTLLGLLLISCYLKYPQLDRRGLKIEQCTQDVQLQ